MGNVSSKPSSSSLASSSSSLASPPSSPRVSSSRARFGLNSSLTVHHPTPPPRSSFTIESSTPKVKHQLHKRSHSHSARPQASRSQNSDSGNSTGKSQHELVLDTDNTISQTGTNADSPVSEDTVGTTDLKTACAETTSTVTFSDSTSFQVNKPLPSAASLLPQALAKKHIPHSHSITSSSSKTSSSSSSSSTSTATTSAAQSSLGSLQKSDNAEMIWNNSSISQQSIHSQSSLSDKSSVSNGSGGSGIHTTATPATSVTEGTTGSLSQLGLQRFPTGEIEYKNSPRQNHDAQIKASRTTSTTSSSSARSSSGNSGFKFTKPNLSFKPLLYSHGNDSKSQQSLYRHTNNSSLSPPSSGHQYDSPFPAILLSIKLPQSLLNKYVIDQEGFRHGKGIWGIGRYSWTITVLSKTNGKKYVIKRVSKSLLPPSAYYHYPTTAHRLCTCPACKASRDHLLMTGQLEDHELEKIKEVLVIQNRGKKDLPQLPPSSPTQQQQQQQKQLPQRPLSASSISPPSSKESKEKRRSFNMYSTFNGSMPNHHGKFLTFGSSSSPHNTPTNSRPTTPSPSPLRLFSNPVASSTSPMSSPVKSHSRSHSQSDPTTPRNAQTSKNVHSPLSPSETPLSWPSKDNQLKVPQAINVHSDTEPSSGISFARPPISTRSSHASYSKKRPALKRHSSTPNMSRPATGLDALEDDPSRLDQLKQLSRFNKNGCRSQDNTIRLHLKDARPYEFEAERQLFDSPHTMAPAMPSWLSVAKADIKSIGNDTNTYEQLQSKISMGIERKVDPFDSNGGEFSAMDPVSPKFTKPLEPIGFVPPPHALPMELVLLQTYNDSDHLPEHHEWTQDEDYWYYVTKSHGVRRRKLKKVSTWWLDVSSLGSAFSSGSSSHEPIATRPIYDMGHSTGDSTPVPSGSPLSSEVALPNGGTVAPERGASGRHTPKQSVSSNHESYPYSMGGTFKRQSSPRNSSHMGKYYYVDWDEYTSS